MHGRLKGTAAGLIYSQYIDASAGPPESALELIRGLFPITTNGFVFDEIPQSGFIEDEGRRPRDPVDLRLRRGAIAARGF